MPTEPEDGTLLALTYSLGSGFALLAQRLETPWPAGQTRALTFDVDGQGVLDRLRLSFLGSAEECPQPEARELLASSLDVDRRLGWERDVCLEITPDQDVQWFLLTAEASLPPVLDAGIVIGQVFVDNIRESERCP